MTSLTALFPMLTWEFKMRALEQYYNHGFHELKTMFLEISERLCMVRSKKTHCKKPQTNDAIICNQHARKSGRGY